MKQLEDGLPIACILRGHEDDEDNRDSSRRRNYGISAGWPALRQGWRRFCAGDKTVIDNPLFKMPEGRKTYFRSRTKDGLETGEIFVTGATRKFMGVRTLVIRDRVFLDGELVEDTQDYIAQHKNGTVWYFGEDVGNYEGGVLVNHDGTWHAGVDGAQPGIPMLSSPKPGQVYREEFYKGVAEDMAKVLSVTETVRTPLGTFNNCLKTENSTPLEPGLKEHKFYCRQAGGLVLEKNLQSGERNVLVKIEDCD